MLTLEQMELLRRRPDTRNESCFGGGLPRGRSCFSDDLTHRLSDGQRGRDQAVSFYCCEAILPDGERRFVEYATLPPEVRRTYIFVDFREEYDHRFPEFKRIVDPSTREILFLDPKGISAKQREQYRIDEEGRSLPQKKEEEKDEPF